MTPPDPIAVLAQSVHEMQLQLVVLNERLPMHVESTDRRLSEHDVRLANHGDRLYSREKEAIELRGEMTALRALVASTQKPKTPWYSIVGGVVTIVTGISVVVGLLVMFATPVPALAAIK